MNTVKERKEDYLEMYKQEKKLRTSIYQLAHEIKNPLAVCNGYLDMMPRLKEPSQEKYLTIIREEIKRTLSVINDFSFFCKEKKLELEELDLNLLLEDTISTIRSLIEKDKGKIIFTSREDLYFTGDYVRLKQALMNIMKNAVESVNDKQLLLKIKVNNRKKDYEIVIKDNGCGMDKEELQKIYDTYYTTKRTGTGLGIPYTKEIIELHQGTIQYHSKKNEGTSVTITLPKEKSPKTFNNNNY